LKGDSVMRIRRYSLLSALVFLSAFLAAAQATEFTETIEVYRQSPAVQPFFEESYGYAVFPHIGKGGIGIGGAFGEGQVYVDEEITGTVRLIKATIGFQLGGEVFSEIIFFRTNGLMMNLPSVNLSLMLPCPLWPSPPVPMQRQERAASVLVRAPAPRPEHMQKRFIIMEWRYSRIPLAV
jgi:hypothetical protein